MARETEAGITQGSCVLKEAHGFSRREYHTNTLHIHNDKTTRRDSDPFHHTIPAIMLDLQRHRFYTELLLQDRDI